MSDPFGLFQARHVSGEHLEVMGKEAARQFHDGRASSLSDAVLAIVKEAALSPEHVRRVVEAANTEAFLHEFRKEGAGGAEHRFVDFGAGGPADAETILAALNSRPPSVMAEDAGLADYRSPPREKRAASTEGERALSEAFGADDAPLPFANPLADAMSLRDKLAAASEHLDSEIRGLDGLCTDFEERLYGQVKQAALGGVPLGHIADAWLGAGPHAHVPLELFGPRLVRDGVFQDAHGVMNSLEKTAADRVVNRDHPLISDFIEFSEALEKLAHRRAAQGELQAALDEITTFVKRAALAGEAYRAAARGSHALATSVSPMVGKALGSGAEWGARKVLENAHNIGLGLGASEAYTHLQHSPNPVARAARGAGNVVLRNIPGTNQNLQHRWEVENGQ